MTKKVSGDGRDEMSIYTPAEKREALELALESMKDLQYGTKRAMSYSEVADSLYKKFDKSIAVVQSMFDELELETVSQVKPASISNETSEVVKTAAGYVSKEVWDKHAEALVTDENQCRRK